MSFSLPSSKEWSSRELNDHGRDIWIEKEGENGGKPVIWYSLDSKGRKQKHVRDANGDGHI